MLSWGVAFRKAGAMVLYMIGWGILGGIFIGIGFATDSIEALVFFIIVGYLIIFFGMIATGIKIYADATAEAVDDLLSSRFRQLSSQRAEPVRPPLPPQATALSACPSCGAGVRRDASFCANCGAATSSA